MNTVSLIIPTYKRANNLLKCLYSVDTQSYQPLEVLIVDGDETDNLTLFLKENFKSNLRYRIIKSLAGLTRQRNVGIRNATGDIVLFVDDDVILDKGHVKEINAVFQRFPDNIGGVSGFVQEKADFENSLLKAIYNLYAKIFFLYHEGDGRFLPSGFAAPCSYKRCKDITPVEFLYGSNMAFRRDVILQFGFDENLYRYMYLEDDDIAYRISRKYQNYWTPFAKLEHIGPEQKRDDFIRGKALFRNHLYLYKKNSPKTLKHKYAFFVSIIGWLGFEFFNGILKFDFSRFLGMVSNILIFGGGGNE